jgi:hypothetical protein
MALPTDDKNIYNTSPGNTFNYTWKENISTLFLRYSPPPEASTGITVSISVALSASNYFDMQISVTNNWGNPIKMIGFPNELLLPFTDNDRALLPFEYPGIILNSNFFKEKRSCQGAYPEDFHSDFIAFQIQKSTVGLYTLRDGFPFQFNSIGLRPHGGNPYPENFYACGHAYSVWITKGNTWTSPISRFKFAESFIELVKDFRKENNIHLFPSLKDKLGSKYDTITRSPLIYNAFGESSPYRFNELAQAATNIPSPALLLLGSYYPGGFTHGLYPDIIPPDPVYGTNEDFRKMSDDLHKLGLWVMPFTLPTWWNEESPTVRNLNSPSAIKDISQLDISEKPIRTYWDLNGDTMWGYFVSPYSQFVVQRLDKMMQELKNTLHNDVTYWDVLGAHGCPSDFNANAPDPVSYNQGWLEYSRKYRNNLIVTESGNDRLAETTIGFMGTLRIPEYLNQPDKADQWYLNSMLGSKNWRPFPVAPFLYHDKVIPYPFWGSTNYKELLSWNLLFGIMLNYSDWSEIQKNSSQSWFTIVTCFQQMVVARIIGKLMTDYTEISNNVTQSTFEDIVVTRNWDAAHSYVYGKHSIATEGALVTSSGGDLTAGIFQRFNNEDLSSGDHYLIVNNYKDSIVIRQPMGNDTQLAIDKPGSWTNVSGIKAYFIGKSNLIKVPVSVTTKTIRFNWQRELSKDTVDYYLITSGNAIYSSENIAICSGQNYNCWIKEGRYTRKLVAKSGSDSIVTTFLTVNPLFNITENRTICQGQNYRG